MAACAGSPTKDRCRLGRSATIAPTQCNMDRRVPERALGRLACRVRWQRRSPASEFAGRRCDWRRPAVRLVLEETSGPSGPGARNPPRVAAHERSLDLVADQSGPMVRHGRSCPHPADPVRGVAADLLGRRAGGRGPAFHVSQTAAWLALLLIALALHELGHAVTAALARVRPGRGASLAAGEPGRPVVQDAVGRAFPGRAGRAGHQRGDVPGRRRSA